MARALHDFNLFKHISGLNSGLHLRAVDLNSPAKRSVFLARAHQGKRGERKELEQAWNCKLGWE